MARDYFDESKKKKTTKKAATTKSQSSSASKPKAKATIKSGTNAVTNVAKAAPNVAKVNKGKAKVAVRSGSNAVTNVAKTAQKQATTATVPTETQRRTKNRDANLNLKQTKAQESRDRLKTLPSRVDNAARDLVDRSNRWERENLSARNSTLQAQRRAKSDERREIGQAQKSGDYDRVSKLTGTAKEISEHRAAEFNGQKAKPLSARAKYEQWDRDLSDTVWHTIKQGLAADARVANLGRKGITQKDAFLYTTKEQRDKADAKVAKLDKRLGKTVEKETQAIQDIQNRHGYVGKQALSAVSSATGMGMDIAAGAIIPGSSLFHMWTRSTGTSLGEVNKKADNLRKQLKASGQYTDDELDEMFKNVNALDLANAGASGGIEVLSELLFPGVGAARKVIGGKGMSIAERAGAKLFNKVGARATGGLLKNLTKGTLEEVAEEEIGGPLQALSSNLIYGNKFQGYNEDAIKRSLNAESNALRSNIQTEADAQAAAARLSSKSFMDESVKAYMQSGYSKEEATKLAEMSREYLTASLTGDLDTMKKYQDQMVNIMAGGENSQKQKFGLQDAIDAAVSTSMMTLVTGAPSALSTMQVGNAYKENNGLAAVKDQAEIIKNLGEPKDQAKAQAIIDHIDNGGDLSGTQVYEIVQQAGELAEENKQPEVIKNRVAEVEMAKRDLRISPVNQDGTLAPQTQQRYEQIVSDTVSRHETLARLSNNQDRAEDFVGPKATFDQRNANTAEESLGDVYIGASIGAAFKVGAINSEMVNELARGSETVKEVFREVTGIDVSQFESYKHMNDSLMAEAADNLVNSARIEQAAWNDEARKQVSDYVRSSVQGSQGDLAIQDALESVDPRDRTQFLMTADVAANLYDFARHTEGSWNEARKMVKEMYPSVDANVLKQVFVAAKEDKQIAETKGYGKVIKSGEKLDRGSLANAETAVVAGKFIDKRENKEGATLTEESLAKNIVSGFGINVELVDNLESVVKDKDGNVVLDEEGNPVMRQDNGMYIPATNTLVINAGADATRTVTQTAVHELTHHIAIHAPEEYVKLSRYIMDAWYRKDPEGFTRAIKARQAAYKAQKNQDLSDEQALEEIIADGAADFDWADEDFIAEVTTKEPTLASKIIDAIKDVLQKIRNILSSGSVIDERARDALYDKAVELDTVRAMWVKAAQTARKAQADQAVDEWQDKANRASASEAYNDYEADVESGVISAGFGDESTRYSIREEDPPKKTIKAYKVFVAFKSKPGELYPPMVASPGGMPTPVGRWINADTGELARNKDGSLVTTKKGRVKVQEGGKGTNKGKGGSLAWRPGWHLGSYPDAKQFAVKDPETGEARTAFPPNFIWAECEIAADNDYQLEALSYGVTEKGKFDRTQAGLPYIPKDGYYKYRTNADPKTVPWLITGAMKVNRILDDDEAREICAQYGATPMKRAGGDIDLAEYGFERGEVIPTSDEDLAKLPPAVDYSDEIRDLPGYVQRDINFDDPQIQKELAMNGQDAEHYRALYEEQKFGGEAQVRFSLSEPVERSRDLIAVHNIRPDELKKAFKLGGFPMPSIAVTKDSMGHDMFGDISLMFHSDTIDPKKNRNNRVYGGDAYTPEFPDIVNKYDRKVANRVEQKIEDLLGMSLSEAREMGIPSVPAFDDGNLDNKLRYKSDAAEAYYDNETMRIAYLRDTGRDVEIPMTQGNRMGKEPAFFAAVADAIPDDIDLWDFDVVDELRDDVVQAMKDYTKSTFEQGLDPRRKAMRLKMMEDLYDRRGSDILAYAYQYKEEGGFPERVDALALTGETNQVNFERQEYEKWLNDLFDGIIEKQGIRNNKDTFTPNYNRRSWESLHDPVTLDNIVKAMKGKLPQGYGGIRGAAQKNYKNLDEIRADEDRLQIIPEEQYESYVNETMNDFQEAIRDILDTHDIPGDNWDFEDTLVNILNETRDKKRIQRIISDTYNTQVSDEQMDALMDVLIDMASIPTGYFEAKPRRAVGFDEVRAAIIPQNTNGDIKEGLSERGISTYEYDPEVEGDRTRAVNEAATDQDLRFSLSDPANANDYAEEQLLEDSENTVQDLSGSDLNIRYSFGPEGTFYQKGFHAKGGTNVTGSDVKRKKGNPLLESGKDILAQKMKKSINAELKKQGISTRSKVAKEIVNARIESVMNFMDAMNDFMEETGLQYTFIGMQDVHNAKISVRKTNDGIQSITMSAMVKNGEYPINFDFTTICKKRQAFNAIIEKLTDESAEGADISLSPKELGEINNALRKEGLETACLGCFVEARRYNMQNYTNKVCDLWNKCVDDYAASIGIDPADVEDFNFANGEETTEAKFQDAADTFFTYENTAASKKNPEDRFRHIIRSSQKAYMKHLHPADLITSNGIQHIKDMSTKDKDFFGMLKSAYGVAAPKETIKYVPYNSEVALLPENKGKNKDGSTQTMLDYLKSIGGIRMQSFSDYLVANTFDYMQMVADMAARGFPAHAYTKEIAFARVFGMTGIKINLSIMYDVQNMNYWRGIFKDASDERIREIAAKYAGLQYFENVDDIPEEFKDYDNDGNLILDHGSIMRIDEDGVKGYLTYLVGDENRSQRYWEEVYSQVLEETGDQAQAEEQANETRKWIQSINFKEAKDLQRKKGYGRNCGMIGVGLSDANILLMLNDDNMPYIIPYHASGLPDVIKQHTGLNFATNYEDTQNTRIFVSFTKDGKELGYEYVRDLKNKLGSWQKAWEKVSEEIRNGDIVANGRTPRAATDKEPAEVNKDGNPYVLHGTADFDFYEKLDNGATPQEAAEMYLDYCDEYGLLPVFPQFAGHPNYYKLLVDYNVTDLSNKKATSPQGTVNNIYPGSNGSIANIDEGSTDYDGIKGILEDEFKKLNEKNKHRDEVVDKIVEEWKSKDIRHSITPDMDAAYMDAVNNEDMDEAQRLVDEAAKMAGMRVAHRYHGTMNANFTVFDKAYAKVGGNSGAGFYFSTEKDDSLNHYQDVEGADNYFKWSSLAEQINQQIEYGEWEGPELETYEDVEEYAKAQLNANPGTFDVYLNYKNPYVRNGRSSTNIFNMLDGSFDDSVVDRNDYDSEDDYDDAWREAYYEHISEKIYEAVYGAMADLENFYDVLEAPDVSDVASKLTEQAIDYESLTWANIEFAVSEHGYISLIRDDWVDSGYGAPEFTRAIVENFGYDAIEDKEVSKKFGQLSREMMTDTEHIIVFKPEQIKLSDPVTYAEDGSVIPLSERFDPDNDDIRYSLPTQDSDGKILTDGQMEYFKNSQARDEQGRLVPVYHTTNKGGFTIFDPMRSDDHRSLFFAEDWDTSQTYGNYANSRFYYFDIDNIDDVKKYLDAYSPDRYFVTQEQFDQAGGWEADMLDFENVTNGEQSDFAKYLDNPDGYIAIIGVPDYSPDNTSYADTWVMAKSPDELVRELHNHFGWQRDNYRMGTQHGYYACYLNLEDPYIIDAHGDNWNEIHLDDYDDDVTFNTREIAEMAMDMDFDGVIIRNLVDHGGMSPYDGMFDYSDIYIAFSSNQVKDINNENPTENPDIRYSIPSEEEVTAYALDKAESTSDIWYTDPVLQEGRVRFSVSSDNFVNRVKTDWRETRETSGRTLDTSSVETDVRSLVKTIMKNSEVDKKYNADVTDQATDAVKEIFRLFKSGKLEDAARYAWDAAEDIVKNVEYVDDEMYQKYKGVISYLADTKIAAPYELMDDPEFSEFVTENLAKFLVKKRGEDIRNVYTHLNKSWPKMFPKLDHPVDMFLQISEVMDAIQPYTEAYSSEEAAKLTEETAAALVEIAKSGEAYRSAADIMNPIFDEQTKAMKQRHKEALQNVRNRRDELLSKEKEKTSRQKERADKWKEKYNARVQKDAEKRKERKQRQMHQKLYDKVLKEYKSLTDRLLKPSKDRTKNIPEQLRQPLAEMLAAFDLEKEKSKELEEKYRIPTRTQINFRQIKDALESIVKEEGAETEFDVYLNYIGDKITALADKMDAIGEYTIDALDIEDIDTIQDMLTGIDEAIKNWHQLEIDGEKYQAQQVCDDVGEGAKDHQKLYGKAKEFSGPRRFMDNIMNMGELTPIYFFRQIKGIYDMYRQLRKGFDSYVQNEKVIIDKLSGILSPYYKKNKKGARTKGSTIEEWRHSESAETFDLTYGSIRLTVAQKMSLYCLARREGALAHMYSDNGGIVASEITPGSKMHKAEEMLKGKEIQVEHLTLTPADVEEIITTLTEDQKNVADQLQRLLSEDMSEIGNKTSMKLIGIRMYKEKDYFPIKVQGESLPKNLDKIGMREKVRNPGFSNPLQDNATNPIIIDDIFSVVASHCNEMNMYAAYAVPLTNFMKVYNGSVMNDKGKPVKIQTVIKQTYGEKAIQYIENFLDDINGNSFRRKGGLDDVLDKAIGQAKKAAVFANLRVAMQQPTAIIRALAVMNLKSFAGVHPSSKATQEMFEHCPIALWKSWGYYDTHFGRDIEDVMMGEDVPSKISFWMSEIYGTLDNMTWGMIWQAVKNEVDADIKAKGLKVEKGSQEYWDMVNERASFVFDTTQVVDSPFHRSNDMRSKDRFTKQMTSFMAEPTLSFNMLRQGIVDAYEALKKGETKKAEKTILRVAAVWTGQALAVALAQSFVDALRRKGHKKEDDDEDATLTWYQEFMKYFIRNFGPNFADDINPVNNVYWFKDFVPGIINALKGEYVFGQSNLAFQWYDAITSGIQKCKRKWDKGDEDSNTWYDCLTELLGGVGYISGLPVKTVMRGAKNAVHWFNKITGMTVFADDGRVADKAIDSFLEKVKSNKEEPEGGGLFDSIANRMGYQKIGSGDVVSETTSEGSTYSQTADDLPDNLTDEQKEEILKAGEKRSKKNEGKEEEAREQLDYDTMLYKAMKAAAGLEGEEYNQKVYSSVAQGLKGYIADGDYMSIGMMRTVIEQAGGDVEYFDKRVMEETKSAYKKTLNYEQTYEERNNMKAMYRYMMQHGMSQEELSSEIVYKSDLAKDMKVAYRVGDENTIYEAMLPLVDAGITDADLEKLYKYRNRMNLEKYKENGRYKDLLKSTGTFIWPVNGYMTITSKFGARGYVGPGASRNHPAIDIGCPNGTPISAADGGVVIVAGWNGGYGNSVGIKHDNGMVTYYNHLSDFNVKVGDTVAQGQTIAASGNTGTSYGGHLDFKVMDANGKAVDPEKYLDTTGATYDLDA
jgi:murein DD-endopeptidase MepM/ murein hydrolase activator NlpD